MHLFFRPADAVERRVEQLQSSTRTCLNLVRSLKLRLSQQHEANVRTLEAYELFCRSLIDDTNFIRGESQFSQELASQVVDAPDIDHE